MNAKEKWEVLAENMDLVIGNPDASEIYVGDMIYQRGNRAAPFGVVISNEEDTITATLGSGDVVKLDKHQFGKETIPQCDSCESDKIHHDTKEQWLCPFCEL